MYPKPFVNRENMGIFGIDVGRHKARAATKKPRFKGGIRDSARQQKTANHDW